MRINFAFIITFLILGMFSAKGQQTIEESDAPSKEITNIKELDVKGIGLYNEGHYQEAAFTFQNAAELLENKKVLDKEKLAKCYYKIAQCYRDMEWYDLSKEFACKSIKYAKKLEQPFTLVYNFSLLGEIYHKKGQFDKALSYYDSCLQIDRRLKDTIYIANDLQEIGRINTKIGREKEGLEQLQEAVRLTNKKKNKRAHCLSLNALGLGYLNCKKYETARKYLLESLQISQEIQDTFLILNRFINLGSLYVKMGKTEVAEMYLLRSLGLLNKSFQPHRLTVIYRNLGEVYQQKKAYEKAIEFYEKGEKIAENKGFLPETRLIYEALESIFFDKGDYYDALIYSRKFKEISDSIFSLNTRIRADIFNNKFALAEKEKKVQTLHYANELNQKDLQILKSHRKWLLFSLFLLTLLVGVSFYAFQQRQQILLQKKEVEINKQLNEIAKLRYEIANALIEKDQASLVASLSFEELNNLLTKPLTKREFEILQLIVQGKNNKEIAAEIYLSVNTVKFHLKNLYVKLAVKNRLQAVQLVINKK